MDQDLLLTALTTLPQKLMAFDHRIGTFCGYISTGKGITLKTTTAELFLYPLLVYKLLYKPDSITEQDLKSVVMNVH